VSNKIDWTKVVMYRNTPHRLSTSAIAKRMGISPSTLYYNIKRAEELGRLRWVYLEG